MLIRQETADDYGEVYNVVKSAFASAEHSDGTEQDLVEKLRKSAGFVPELSLVAEKDGKIVGEGTPKNLLTPVFIRKVYGVEAEIVHDRHGLMHILFTGL